MIIFVNWAHKEKAFNFAKHQLYTEFLMNELNL